MYEEKMGYQGSQKIRKLSCEPVLITRGKAFGNWPKFWSPDNVTATFNV